MRKPLTDILYAVGDIHGQTEKLCDALDWIERDGGQDAPVVFLGDYVDRGPDSAGVIEELILGQKNGRNWLCIKGNHDRFFEWFMGDIPRMDPHLMVGMDWFDARLGGLETLASYGVTVTDRMRMTELHEVAKAAVPVEHIDFLKELPLTHETDELLFVHAGIRPEVPLKDQSENDLLWIRQPFHNYEGAHPKLIVHGHTPVDAPTHYGNRVNIDTGAGYGKDLTVAAFEGKNVWTLGAEGRKKLKPARGFKLW